MEINGAGEVDPMHDSDKVADIDLDKGLWLQISGKHWADGGGNHVCAPLECQLVRDKAAPLLNGSQEEWAGIAVLTETHCFWGAPHAAWK